MPHKLTWTFYGRKPRYKVRGQAAQGSFKTAHTCSGLIMCSGILDEGRDSQRARPIIWPLGTLNLVGTNNILCHETLECRTWSYWGAGAWFDEHWRAILHTSTPPHNGASLLKICLGKQIVLYRPYICLLSHPSLCGELRQCLKLGPQFLSAGVLMHFMMKRIWPHPSSNF